MFLSRRGCVRTITRLEDIKITNEISKKEFCVSIKAYGDGPLLLSTDKNHRLFPRLQQEDGVINDKNLIDDIFIDHAFIDALEMNALPSIYDEKGKRCNILTFDYAKAKSEIVQIIF